MAYRIAVSGVALLPQLRCPRSVSSHHPIAPVYCLARVRAECFC